MITWNVCLPVVANVNAATAKDAEKRLQAALEAAGFDIITDSVTAFTATFEAEDGTPADFTATA